MYIHSYFSKHATTLYPEEKLQYRTTEQTEKEFYKLLNMMAKDKGKKVVVVGDSFLYGSGVYPAQTAAHLLEKELQKQDPDIKVWNLAMPASHAADVYGILKKVIPMKPDLLIVNTNYFFFTIQEERNHITNKWLIPEFQEEQDYLTLVDKLHLNPIEIAIQNKVKTVLPIYYYKDEINMTFMGYKMGQEFISRNIEKGYKWLKGTGIPVIPGSPTDGSSYKVFYEPHLFTEDQINAVFSQKIAQLLNQSNIPIYLLSSPQNEEVLGDLVQNEIFDQDMQFIDRIFEGHSFVYENLHGKIESKYQMDNIHLTVEGNQILADILYERVTPLLKEGTK